MQQLAAGLTSTVCWRDFSLKFMPIMKVWSTWPKHSCSAQLVMLQESMDHRLQLLDHLITQHGRVTASQRLAPREQPAALETNMVGRLQTRHVTSPARVIIQNSTATQLARVLQQQQAWAGQGQQGPWQLEGALQHRV